MNSFFVRLVSIVCMSQNETMFFFPINAFFPHRDAGICAGFSIEWIEVSLELYRTGTVVLNENERVMNIFAVRLNNVTINATRNRGPQKKAKCDQENSIPNLFAYHFLGIYFLCRLSLPHVIVPSLNPTTQTSIL